MVTLDIPGLGKVTVPERYVGRVSRATGLPSISAAAILRERPELPAGTVRAIVAGKQRPKRKTLEALDAVGVIIHREPYSQAERTFTVKSRTCQFCSRSFVAIRKDKRYCSKTCAIKGWRRSNGPRACNWCGKPSGSRYAYACDDHAEAHAANNRRQAQRRRERGRKGWCISCSRRRAVIGLRCEGCRELAVQSARKRRADARKIAREERLSKGWITTTEARKLLRLPHVVNIHHLIRRGKIVEVGRVGKKPRIWIDARSVRVLMLERGIVVGKPPKKVNPRCPRCKAIATTDEDGAACWCCGWRPTRVLTDAEKAEVEASIRRRESKYA